MRFFPTLILAVCEVISTEAAAVPPADCPQTTRVGLSDLGYSSFQEHGHYRGISVDLVAELARRTGCTFEIGWFPRGRMFVEFQEGNIDMTVAASRSPERDASGVFIAYTQTQYELVLRQGVAGHFTSLADFVEHSQARLDITRGTSYPPAMQVQLDRLRQAGRLDYITDFTLAFRKLAAGRSDGTLAPAVIYQRQIDQLALRDRVTMTALPEAARQEIGAYLSRRNLTPALRARLAAALRDIARDGTLRKIQARYLDAATLKHMFDRPGR